MRPQCKGSQKLCDYLVSLALKIKLGPGHRLWGLVGKFVDGMDVETIPKDAGSKLTAIYSRDSLRYRVETRYS